MLRLHRISCIALLVHIHNAVPQKWDRKFSQHRLATSCRGLPGQHLDSWIRASPHPSINHTIYTYILCLRQFGSNGRVAILDSI